MVVDGHAGARLRLPLESFSMLPAHSYRLHAHRSSRRPTQSFFQRVMHYVINEVLVDTLANSKTFQRFAVRSNVRGPLSLSFSLHLCIYLFLGIVPARACARHPVRLSAVVDARARAVQASPGRPCPAVSLPSLGSPTSFVPRHRRIFRMFPRKAWIIRRALLINLGSFSARCGKSSGIQDPRRRVIVDELACVTNESHYDLQRTCGQPRCHL